MGSSSVVLVYCITKHIWYDQNGLTSRVVKHNSVKPSSKWAKLEHNSLHNDPPVQLTIQRPANWLSRNFSSQFLTIFFFKMIHCNWISLSTTTYTVINSWQPYCLVFILTYFLCSCEDFLFKMIYISFQFDQINSRNTFIHHNICFFMMNEICYFLNKLYVQKLLTDYFSHL